MLFSLALIPVIVLLVFIYFNDKKEKEPIGFLIGLFFAGMASVITAFIFEGIGEAVLEVMLHYFPVLKVVILCMFVVGPVEELGKYAALRLVSWKNKNFDHSYDAIVYSVFVSMGFAAFENVIYVFSNGVGTALLRMFTAVPGHACYAVFMGYFYSKAKYAKLTNNKKDYTLNNVLSIVVPVVIHGIYDALIFATRESGNDFAVVILVLAWIGIVIAMFIVAFIIVIRSSKKDFCIITLPNEVQTIYRPEVAGSWTCACGKENTRNFCTECGKPRPTGSPWNCPRCGTISAYNFCGNCGCPKPVTNISEQTV